MAIGLIFHKFPEGIIIALPFYSATKSKLKAFFLALFGSAFFLFLGAILSYAVFTRYWDPFVGGVILSLTAGILFWLGITVILPLAFKLHHGAVSFGVFVGVFIIALSEVILSYSS